MNLQITAPAGAAAEVVIIQRRLTHYRVALFERLRTALAERGVRLRLLAGEATASEASKQDGGHLPWCEPLPTRYFAGGRVCWQSLGARVNGADLVIVTQENRLLQNHLLQARPRAFRLAFWGHGANLQSSRPNGLRERFKVWTSRRVDWWFGYTDMSVPLIARSGFPADRITVLDNTVDTADMAAMRVQVDGARIARLRAELGLAGSQIGIYVGSLYAEKRIDMLLDAARAIRERVPGFELLIVGGGPLADEVVRFCGDHPWTKYLGVRKGQDKVDAMALSRVTLNPGLVGLGILDTFVCRVPMVTTDCGVHSPEIAYLYNDENGVMTANDSAAYVEAVRRVLTDDALHARLVSGCARSAARYSLDNMVSRFADGIERCLAAPRYWGGGR